MSKIFFFVLGAGAGFLLGRHIYKCPDANLGGGDDDDKDDVPEVPTPPTTDVSEPETTVDDTPPADPSMGDPSPEAVVQAEEAVASLLNRACSV